jgi:hypothetical protein
MVAIEARINNKDDAKASIARLRELGKEMNDYLNRMVKLPQATLTDKAKQENIKLNQQITEQHTRLQKIPGVAEALK